MSEDTTIQIEVLPEAAQVYGLARESERKKKGCFGKFTLAHIWA
ncbi:MAG: hypothetical protein OHK0052_16150 [Anaerolineales bacterium]